MAGTVDPLRNETEALYRVDMRDDTFDELRPVSASELDVKEKNIENWVVGKPDILFSDPESVMIIAKEITGELQADVLVVDSQGTLIIVEIKRHHCDRNVIGQILDYAARLSEWDYEQFDQRWKKDGGRGNLLDAFRKFIDNDSFKEEDFLKERRLYILAAREDESMKRIIAWLRDGYGVPIDFVPFGLFKAGENVFLKISKIDVTPVVSKTEWAGDWFFNANETYAPKAYEKMLGQGVIAACGYGHAKTEHKMNLPTKGQRVFMFVNGKGIVAVGEVIGDSAVQKNSVFGTKNGDEYHREVRWSHAVSPSQAVTSGECSEWGYNLPVRCTIGKVSNNRVADRIEQELTRREPISAAKATVPKGVNA
ncbi:MAG: hypothetical protein RBU21_02215 [FCB group bacterium]|jgi:hypothetical protein|nr:hypothetical protein [FCB group bacterium]